MLWHNRYLTLRFPGHCDDFHNKYYVVKKHPFRHVSAATIPYCSGEGIINANFRECYWYERMMDLPNSVTGKLIFQLSQKQPEQRTLLCMAETCQIFEKAYFFKRTFTMRPRVSPFFVLIFSQCVQESAHFLLWEKVSSLLKTQEPCKNKKKITLLIWGDPRWSGAKFSYSYLTNLLPLLQACISTPLNTIGSSANILHRSTSASSGVPTCGGECSFRSLSSWGMWPFPLTFPEPFAVWRPGLNALLS